MTTITRDEWLKELERVMVSRKGTVDGMTARELAGVWGCCTRVALERLHLLRARLVVGTKPSVAISGRNTTIPCYRLKPEVKRAAKRR